jgi:hypothetical protein
MWLTPGTYQALREMSDAATRGDYEGAEIVCGGKECWLGDRRVQRRTVIWLLRMMAISDRSEEGAALERYCINDTGRAILRRPALVGDINRALVAGGAFRIENDQIIALYRADLLWQELWVPFCGDPDCKLQTSCKSARDCIPH